MRAVPTYDGSRRVVCSVHVRGASCKYIYRCCGGGGGLTIFSEASSVASPNNTIPTFGLLARSLSADVDFAIIPKGSGALLAQIPDGSSVGGNKRGANATDWQRVRLSASEVASGDYSTIGGGGSNIAPNLYSTVGGGESNTASGAYSTVGGGEGNTASGELTIVGGGVSNIASGEYSFIAGGQSNDTNNQANIFILGSNITAPSANYTYVNNLSSQGDVRASSTIYSASGNSNQWNSTYSTVQSSSANWQQTTNSYNMFVLNAFWS